jgi:hypothetical protein
MSIAGNSSFVKVENTVVSGRAVYEAQADVSLSQIQQVQGSFTPTAAANYSVVDIRGSTVQIPPGSLILNVLYTTDVTLVGGTDVQAVLSASDGGSAGTVLTAVSTLADTNLGNNPAVTPTTGTVSTDYYLSATTTGTFTAGRVIVRVIYV